MASGNLQMIPVKHSITLTNFSTGSDGMITPDIPADAVILPSRLIDDNNGHLLIPVGTSLTSGGTYLCCLIDNFTKTVISSQTSLSGTLNYLY